MGVMVCLYWACPKPLGQAYWICLVLCLSSFCWVFPWKFLPWVGMCFIRCMCSFGRWVACGKRTPGFCGRLLVTFVRCVSGVVPIWYGLVFFLCGCDMMSGLLPRIYPYNFVSCISLKRLCTLSIETLEHIFFPVFISLFGSCFWGFSGTMSLIFLQLSFFYSLSTLLFWYFLAVCLLALLIYPKLLSLLCMKTFTFSSRLAQIFMWQNPIFTKSVL